MIDNISRYVSFLSVAKYGSFSAAAKALYISQPALSSDIAKLEKELGIKLFFRTGRGIRLTEAGDLLAEYVTKAMTFIDAGEDKIRDLLDLKAGHLTVGASDMTLKFFLLEYISVFRETYPDVRVKVTNAPSPRTLAALRSGEIDFGVITSSGDDGECSDIDLKALRTVKDVFVCHPDCPLAKKKKVNVQELRDYPLIMLEGETSTGKYVKQMLPELQSADIELATSDLVAEFAARRIGTASVVEDFALPYIKKGELAVIDLAEPIPPRQMYLATLRNFPLSAAAARMVEIIENNTVSSQKEGKDE